MGAWNTALYCEVSYVTRNYVGTDSPDADAGVNLTWLVSNLFDGDRIWLMWR